MTDAVAAAAPVTEIAQNLAGEAAPDMSAANPLNAAVDSFSSAFTKLIHGLAEIPEIGKLKAYQDVSRQRIALDEKTLSGLSQQFGTTEMAPDAAATIWMQKAAELDQAASNIATPDFLEKHGLQGLDADTFWQKLNNVVWDIAANPTAMAGIPLNYENRQLTDNAINVETSELAGEVAATGVIIKGVEASLPKKEEPAAGLAPAEVMEAAPMAAAPATVDVDANAFIKKPGDDGVMTAASATADAGNVVSITSACMCKGSGCGTCVPTVTATPTTVPEAFANYANMLIRAANPEMQPITAEEAAAIIAANGGSFKAAIKDIKNRSDSDYVTLLNTSAENFAEYNDLQKASFLADAAEAKLQARVALTELNPDAVIGMMGSFLSAPAAKSYKPHDIAISHSSKIKFKAEEQTTVIAL